MMLLKINTIHRDEIVSEKYYTVDNIGEAINAHSPDPAVHAVFHIEVLSRDAEVPQLW
jgi:hypothetical protein